MCEVKVVHTRMALLHNSFIMMAPLSTIEFMRGASASGRADLSQAQKNYFFPCFCSRPCRCLRILCNRQSVMTGPEII